jgi:hypothetical protein
VVDKNLPILIASSSFDEETHLPVRQRLERRGYEVIVYLTDRVIEGAERLTIEISAGGELTMLHQGRSIAPRDISAAWYWKVGGFRSPSASRDMARQLSLVNELTLWNHTIWGLYPDDLWLNSPRNTAFADMKLQQLLTARQIGFAVPVTVVSSEWAPVDRLMFPGGKVAAKTLRGVLATAKDLKVMFTTALNAETLKRLQEIAAPFPGLYQPLLEKAREWRVTVVGDDVFAAAIYTDDEARDDWRRLQTTPAVRFRREQLPIEIEAACRRYLHAMRLGFGAFDLIERPDGEIVFLECNPSGQHNWLEQELGLPIADAIATQLTCIAERRNHLH